MILRLILARNRPPRDHNRAPLDLLLRLDSICSAVGLVGEYVAKIMTEVKGRPRLIRAELIRNGKSTDLCRARDHRSRSSEGKTTEIVELAYNGSYHCSR